MPKRECGVEGVSAIGAMSRDAWQGVAKSAFHIGEEASSESMRSMSRDMMNVARPPLKSKDYLLDHCA